MSSIDETSKVYNIITDQLSDLENVLILNYNYTSSIDYILNQRSLKYDILSVHGNAKNSKIVFGVEDQARINEDDVFLKKSACLWNEVQDINKILQKAKNIIFLGYSLGETDHHYFDDFFRSSSFSYSEKKSIIISHYKEDGMYDVLKQLDKLTGNRIQNLRTHQDFRMFDLSE